MHGTTENKRQLCAWNPRLANPARTYPYFYIQCQNIFKLKVFWNYLKKELFIDLLFKQGLKSYN